LENRRGKDDEILRRVWKVVETKAEETRVAEVKGEREKKKSQKIKREWCCSNYSLKQHS